MDEHAVAERHGRRNRSNTDEGGALLLGFGIDLGVHDVSGHLRRVFEDGAKARQGPHHDAQTSTSTVGLSMIVDSKFARVKLVVVMACPFK